MPDILSDSTIDNLEKNLDQKTKIKNYSVGQYIGSNFHVDRVIGRGNFGYVYQVTDKRDNKPYAVKIIYEKYSERKPAVDRLVKIVSTLKKITHPNLVRLFEGGMVGGLVYLKLEYIPDQTLYDLISGFKDQKATKGFPSKSLIGILEQIIDGMENIKIPHLLLKPKNIFVSKTGQIKISDVGIFSAFGPTLKREEMVTFEGLQFIAPEVLSLKVLDSQSFEAADIYSLGKTMANCIELRIPLKETAKILHPVGQFSPDFISLVSSMMSHLPSQRPKSIEIVGSRLRSGTERDLAYAREAIPRPPKITEELPKPAEVAEQELQKEPFISPAEQSEQWVVRHPSQQAYEEEILATKHAATPSLIEKTEEESRHPSGFEGIELEPSTPILLIQEPLKDQVEKDLFKPRAREVAPPVPPLAAPSKTAPVSKPMAPIKRAALQKAPEKFFTFPIIAGLAAVLIVAVIALIWAFTPSQPSAPSTLPLIKNHQPSKSGEEINIKEGVQVGKVGKSFAVEDQLTSVVNDLLAEAEALSVANQIFWPRDNNAVDLYKQVLKINPNNKEATTQLAMLDKDYTHRAKDSLNGSDFAKAKEYATKALIANPRSIAADILEQIRKEEATKSGKLAVAPTPNPFQEIPKGPTPAPSSSEPEDHILANLTPDMIQKVVGKYQGRMRVCYAEALQENPSLKGRISIRFTINSNGDVSNAQVASSNLGNAAMDECVMRRVSRMKFPAFNNSPKTVVFPFDFQE